MNPQISLERIFRIAVAMEFVERGGSYAAPLLVFLLECALRPMETAAPPSASSASPA